MPATVAPRVGTVAVTGAAAGLGRALVERLARAEDLDALIGVDTAGVRVDGVVWRTADVRDPVLADRLSGVGTVVHLATSFDVWQDAPARRALNVRGTALLLAAARSAGVRRVVLVTSADVYGARPGNPLPLPESAAPRAAVDASLTGEHAEIEALAAPLLGPARSGLEVTVLRPATLVGAQLGPGYDGARLQLLSAPRLVALRGTEPLWQLCHADDLLTALELAVRGLVRGPVAVACDGWLAQRDVEAAAGRRRLELPPGIALGTAERLHRLGRSGSPAQELAHLTAPLVVATDALRDAGWSPAWTNEAALRAYLAGRASDTRAGTYTAAGATVALVGTAALVRRARRRRGR